MVYRKYTRNKYTRKRNKYTRKKKIQKGGSGPKIQSAAPTPTPKTPSVALGITQLPPVKRSGWTSTRNFTKGTGALIGTAAISGVGLVSAGIKAGLKIVPGVLKTAYYGTASLKNKIKESMAKRTLKKELGFSKFNIERTLSSYDAQIQAIKNKQTNVSNKVHTRGTRQINQASVDEKLNKYDAQIQALESKRDRYAASQFGELQRKGILQTPQTASTAATLASAVATTPTATTSITDQLKTAMNAAYKAKQQAHNQIVLGSAITLRDDAKKALDAKVQKIATLKQQIQGYPKGSPLIESYKLQLGKQEQMLESFKRQLVIQQTALDRLEQRKSLDAKIRRLSERRDKLNASKSKTWSSLGNALAVRTIGQQAMASYEMGKSAMRYYNGDTGVTSAANTFRRGWEKQKTAGNIKEGAQDVFYTALSPMALKYGLDSKAKQFGRFVKDTYAYKTLDFKDKITLLSIKNTLEKKINFNLNELTRYKNLLAQNTEPSDRVKYNAQIRYYEDRIAKENLLLAKTQEKLAFNFPKPGESVA